MPEVKMKGIDVSRYQGTIDWGAVKAAGYHSAIIKATEGQSYGYTDYFYDNVHKAANAGLRVGAYHFLRSGGTGSAQALYFRDVLNRSGIAERIMPVVDCETAGNGSNPNIGDIEQFCNAFHDMFGIPPVLYTYNSWWNSFVGSRPVPVPDLWIARYRSLDLGPGPTPMCDNLIGWQHSSTGSVSGIAGNVDLNVWYIDGAGWDARTLAGEGREDVMQDSDFERIEAIVGRLGHHLMTGSQNSHFTPNRTVAGFKYDWVDDGSTIHLTDLMPKGVAGQLDVSRAVIDAHTADNPELPDWFEANMKTWIKDVLVECGLVDPES